MKPRPASATTRVGIRRLPHGEGLALPAYQTAQAAGLDLAAAVAADGPAVLAAHARMLVPTGLVLELPAGYEAQVRPRSGLALRHGVTVLNAPGTIDADYRGEVMVLLVNHGSEPFAIRRGDRIAQLIVAPVAHAELVEIAETSGTARGGGGFGSTGTVTDVSARDDKSKPPARQRQTRNKPLANTDPAAKTSRAHPGAAQKRSRRPS